MKKLLISFLFSILIFLSVFGTFELEKALASSDYEFRIFSPIERMLLDLRFYYHEENFANREIIREYKKNSPFISHEALIVGIDQESLIEIGEWPWYRNVYKDFIRKVQHFSPLSLHLDIIFNLNEEIPTYLGDKLSQGSPKIFNIVKDNYLEMDGVFIEELKNHDNIFVDQLLLKSRFLRFEPDFVQKLNLNEQILKRNSIPYTSEGFPVANIPYVFTEPLIPGVMQNAIPAIVNAESDSDKILRKSVLLYPYQTQKNEKLLLSSIYLSLFLNYYHISKENVEILPDRLVLRDALTPSLQKETKNPIVEIWDLPYLTSVLTGQHLQKEDYNQNLYHYIINLFRGRFKKDEIKMPNLPIQILDNEDGTYSIIRGHEIFDAASELKSKQVKVMVKKKRNLEIPMFQNQDSNPFTYYINFGSRETVQGKDGNFNFSEFILPKKSFKDIYHTPYLPAVPEFKANTDSGIVVRNLISRPEVRQWFTQLLDLKIKSMQKTVFNLYQNIDTASMLNYAIQDNHYEGFFYLVNTYIQQKGWNLNPKVYRNFVVDLFKRNDVPLEHPLITDFSFNGDVIYDFLLDTYGQGYNDFYGKSIFVGSITTGMARDVHKTTYGDMFGITTIVNSFNTVVKENFLRQFNYYKEIFSLFIFCILMGLAYTYLPLFLKYFFIFFSTLGIIIVSIYLFTTGYILNTFPFIVSNVLIFPTIMIYTIFVEQRDKRFLQLSFSDYLAPELIEEMYEKKERPQLGGEEKKIAAYFTDIQSFSSFSELLTPSQLVELLNEYLGKMTDILMEKRGTLDKYEGDAIIAFFGAPSHLGDESFRACKTALEMQKALVQLTEKWKQEKSTVNLNQKESSLEKWDPQYKWPFLVHNMKMRIGVNTGDVVVGNMGSEKRKNYTMMGDAVNLAARLESLSKQYGLFILISEYVLEAVNENDTDQRKTKEFIFTRKIDRVKVVGKEEPIDIYELISITGEETEEQKSLKEFYEAGLDHYFQMEWNQAVKCFQQGLILESNQKINPSQVMINRCKELRKNPPVKKGEKWDGSFQQTKK